MNKLNGSEKQIAWAEEIREYMLNGSICQGHCVDEGIKQHLESLEKQIARYTNKAPARTEEMVNKRIKMIAEMKKHVELFNNLKNKIEHELSAVWVIDNKNNSVLFNKEVFSK